MKNIIDHFEKYFEIIYANTPNLLSECRKLRYQTFCVEKEYLDMGLESNSHEIDEYDTRSAHSLIRHKDTGIYAATVRIVLPSIANPVADYPIETHLSGRSLSEYQKLMQAPRKNVAEISRFIISRDFRQRMGEINVIHGLGNDFGMLTPKIQRQFVAQISLGLFKAIVQMSKAHRIFYWLALMEPSLIRLLARIGVHFNHLSSSINMCGARHVCFENSAEVLLGGRRQRPDIWGFVTNNGECTLPELMKQSTNYDKSGSFIERAIL